MRWTWIDRFTAFESRRSATAVKCLSLAEVIRLCRSEQFPEIDSLRKGSIDTYTEEGAPRENAQYVLLNERVFRNPDALRKWFQRMLQVPFDGDAAVVKSEAEFDRLKALYPGLTKCISWNEWISKAYPHETAAAAQ